MNEPERNSQGARRGSDEKRTGRGHYRPGLVSGEAWSAFSTLLAGTGFWGLVGYGIDRLTGIGTVFLPVGILVGMAASVYLVIYRAMRRS